MSRIGRQLVSSEQTTVPAAVTPVSILSTAQGGTGLNTSAMSGLPMLINGTWTWYATSAFDLTGATENTTQLQTAVTACSAAGGGIIYLPPGTILVDQITLASNVWLVGSGHATIIKSKASANDYALACATAASYYDNITIANLTIDGNKANNTSGGGIYLHGRNHAVLNCSVHDCANVGILLGVPSNGAVNTPLDSGHRIVGNYVKDCSLSTGGWGGIAVTHGRNIAITDNVIESTDAYQTYGIDLEPNTGCLCESVTVANNVIRGGRIFVDGTNITAITNVAITGNIVDASAAFNTAGTNNACLFLRNVTGLTIAGNECIGNSSYGQQGASLYATVADFAITNNLFRLTPYASGSEYGIWVNNDASQAVRGMIAQNTFVSATAFDYGVYSFHATGLVNVSVGPNVGQNITTLHSLGSAGLSGNYTNPLLLNGVYVWSTDAAVLYIKTTAPTTATDGTIIGSQS